MSAPSLSLLKEKIRKKKKLGFTERASAVEEVYYLENLVNLREKKLKAKNMVVEREKRKICIICKVYLIEKIKDVYVCPVCKAIVNERLDDRK